MCYECWQEYGSPKIVTDRVLETVKAIERVYDFSLVGGGLHIVIDDWNLEDARLDFCKEYIAKPDYDECREQQEVEQACLELLYSLNLDERASALAIHDGFFEPTAMVDEHLRAAADSNGR